jgi:hypothetical protein
MTKNRFTPHGAMALGLACAAWSFGACRGEDSAGPVAAAAPANAAAAPAPAKAATAPRTAAAPAAAAAAPSGAVPNITFPATSHDFGSVNEGEVKEHVFKFRNTGTAPLEIIEAQGT